MTTNNDQKPMDTTEADSSAGVSCAAAAGYALTCEHQGCNATDGVADYVRYTSDLDDDDEGDDLTAEERSSGATAEWWLRLQEGRCRRLARTPCSASFVTTNQYHYDNRPIQKSRMDARPQLRLRRDDL